MPPTAVERLVRGNPTFMELAMAWQAFFFVFACNSQAKFSSHYFLLFKHQLCQEDRFIFCLVWIPSRIHFLRLLQSLTVRVSTLLPQPFVSVLLANLSSLCLSSPQYVTLAPQIAVWCYELSVRLLVLYSFFLDPEFVVAFSFWCLLCVLGCVLPVLVVFPVLDSVPKFISTHLRTKQSRHVWCV